MPPSPVSILIIGDQPDLRIYLANLLRAHDFTAIAVSGVLEGMLMIERHAPSLVVLDAMLPEDGAYRAYSNLRCEETYAHIPVVFLSPFVPKRFWWSQFCGGRPGRRRLPEPDGVLAKPPEAEDFLTMVHRLTRKVLPLKP